ncbi:MAG: sugar-binding domain-containing protein [Rikenellaceae bacterium]
MNKIFSVIALAMILSISNVEANNKQTLSQQGRFSTMGFYAVEDSPRQVENFNLGWRFYKGSIAGAQAVDFDDSQWESASIPHGLEVLPENASGCRNYQGEAWYRKQFRVNRAKSDERLFIYFEAVMGKSKVWVNGELVSEFYGGYLPFAADITDVVNYDGEPNIVAVLADNSDDENYPPGKAQANLDFAYLGGIYRDVYLMTTSPLHVTLPQLSERVAGGGIFISTAKASGDSAEINIRSEVENSSNKRVSVTLKSTLETIDGEQIKTLTKRSSIAPNSTVEIDQLMSVSGVELWHPNHPTLHYIKTEVWCGNRLCDQFRTRFGIRTIEMAGAVGMKINGEVYDSKIIGANRHQDYVYVGNALPNSAHWRDAVLLRQGGCAIVRAAHYPQDDAFYDACDQLGLLTTTASPGWQFFNKVNPLFEERIYEDVRRLVRKDRNRPSIIMWETALNETWAQPVDLLKNMHAIAHEEYPFDGMYTVTDIDKAQEAGLDMYYHGDDPNVNSFIRECGDQVDNWYSHNSVVRVKSEWGENALLQQSEIYSKTLNVLHSSDPVKLGGALWAGFEHQRGYHSDPFWGGLMTLYRLPKYSYYLWRSQYDADYRVEETDIAPTLFIANELTQLSPADVYIYSNCDEVALTINGREIGTISPSDDKGYSHIPNPPFIFKDAFHIEDFKTQGMNKAFLATVVAKGYIDGELVVTTEKAYPLRSESLVLEVDDLNMELVADGSDFVPVRCYVVDANGTKKVLASEYIHFVVEGEGEIIGGAANYANPVKTEMGAATLLVRSTSKSGEIRVKAYSHGLKGAEITLHSNSSTDTMNYDEQYAAQSKRVDQDEVRIIQQGSNATLPADVESLQNRVKALEQELVGKDQEIMELKGNNILKR